MACLLSEINSSLLEISALIPLTIYKLAESKMMARSCSVEKILLPGPVTSILGYFLLI